MTFEEAVAAPGRKLQVWGTKEKDGKRALMIFRLTDGGAEQLLTLMVPVKDIEAMVEDLKARGLVVGETHFHCDFVWIGDADGIEVYDDKRKVLDARGDRVTLADGRVIPRAELARIIAYASETYIHRGVKAELRSGKEVELVPEMSLSAMDPTYSRNELLFETGWTATIGGAIATWAGTEFEDQI